MSASAIQFNASNLPSPTHGVGGSGGGGGGGSGDGVGGGVVAVMIAVLVVVVVVVKLGQQDYRNSSASLIFILQ